MLGWGVDQWPRVVWSKPPWNCPLKIDACCGLDQWVWLVKTNWWVSPGRRFPSSPTHSPTSASGQTQKQTKAVLWFVFRATILEPWLLYVPRCMETFLFSITFFLIFFNHPRRPVLVLTVQLNCAQTVSVYQPTNGSVHARLAWMPPTT